MTCPRCRLDGAVEVEIGGRHSVLVLAQDRICGRCGTEYVAGPGGAPLPVRRRVWMPLFGWVTREDFDAVLPPFTVRRGGIRYDYARTLS